MEEINDGGEPSKLEGTHLQCSEARVSNQRLRGATGGGGEQSEVEVSDQRWRQAIRIVGEQP